LGRIEERGNGDRAHVPNLYKEGVTLTYVPGKLNRRLGGGRKQKKLQRGAKGSGGSKNV